MPEQNRDSLQQSPVEIAERVRDTNGNGSTGNVKKPQLSDRVPKLGSKTGATSPSAPDTPDLASAEQKTLSSCKLLMDFKNMQLRELIEHCLRTTDEAARTEFVKRITPTIRGVAYRRLRSCGTRDLGVVQDLIQETFLKLLVALPLFLWQDEARFYGWVKTITINVAQDWLRRPNPMVSLEDHPDISDGNRTSEDQTMSRFLCDEIVRCLKKIGADKKEIVIFLLFYKYGCSARMIAEIPGTDLSENQVEAKLARLVRQIRRALGNGSLGA